MMLFWLGVAAPASGRPRRVDSDPVAIAIARAVEYWHGTPCAGEVTIVSAAGAEAPPSGENVRHLPITPAAMWASWLTPGGINSFTAPAATFTSCVVHVNRTVWPDWLKDDQRFTSFCKEMLHEYGHFEGHPDIGAAFGTIEYELPVLERVPLCERFRLVYGNHTFIGRLDRVRQAPRRHRRSQPLRHAHAPRAG